MTQLLTPENVDAQQAVFEVRLLSLRASLQLFQAALCLEAVATELRFSCSRTGRL